ncbi:hypothetical protein, partial [Oerskovia enterophila]|uniref:hypothetical protein n=1 Tax=Oerskovia enterophila TaxID=43678 RepID=UPI0033949741
QSSGSGERRSYGDRPQSSGSGERRSYGDRPQSSGSGERRSYGDRPQSSGSGERRSYGDRPQSSGSGERRSYGDRPQSGGGSYGGGERRSYGDRPQSSGSGERRSYGDRPQSGGGERKSYGDRPQSGGGSYGGGERKSYGDRPQSSGSGERRSYGDRPQSGGGERKSYGDRPQSGGGERKSYGDRPQSSGSGERRSYGDRPQQSGGGERKSYGDRPQHSADQGERQSRPPQDQRHAGPEIDEAVQFSDLDRDVRGRLRTLSKENATVVGRHLVMAGKLIDTDPELAYEHAQAAVRRAGRVDVVREAAGLTAYQTGRYAEALRELRTVRRLNGSSEHLPIMADCERGLERPERALALAASEEASTLDAHGRTELALVVSGARADLGEFEAALAVLDQIPAAEAQGDLALRVLQARASVLEAAGRLEEAAAILADVDPRALAAALGTSLDDEVVVYDLTEDAVEIDEDETDEASDTDTSDEDEADASASDTPETVAAPVDETDAAASGTENDEEAK